MEKEKAPLYSLFAHIKNHEQRDALINAYQGSKALFDETITRLILRKLKESYDQIDSEEVYKLPNHQAFLSDQAGYRRALKEVLKLLP